MNLIKKFIEWWFHVPLVVAGQRWQWSEFYNEPINPFDPKSGKRFILKVLEVKDGWMRYEYEDGSTSSDRISKLYKGYILLADGEKE